MRKGISLAVWLFALSVNLVALFALGAFNKLAPLSRVGLLPKKAFRRKRKWKSLLIIFRVLQRKSSKFSVSKVYLITFSFEEETFSFLEPIAAKAGNQSLEDGGQTYFVSFLLRDRKNKTKPNLDGMPKQRMIVNNNFNGDKLGSNQFFVESGTPPKQAPAHNVQLLNNQAQGYQQLPMNNQIPFQQQQQSPNYG